MKKGLPAFEKLSLKIHKPNRNPHSARPPSPGFVQHWLHCPSYGRNEALVISNSTLLETFEDAVCDRNYNPTNDNYNKSGYTYAELKAEILDRITSERA